MISGGEKLMDKHINSSQRLIHAQFPKLNGLVLSLLQNQPLMGATDNAVQIFHVCGDHWIVAATAPGSKMVYVYDQELISAARRSVGMTQLIPFLISDHPNLLQIFFIAVPVMLR